MPRGKKGNNYLGFRFLLNVGKNMPPHCSQLFGPLLHGLDDVTIQSLVFFGDALHDVLDELVIDFECFRELFEAIVEFL